jgi:predicted ATP-grasp superfamily ATP-dependent carboligase
MESASLRQAATEADAMNDFLKVDLRRLSAHRPPALLLGGINLVRALGLARIPVIVASAEPFTPAMASRYCIGRLALPPTAQREAVVERLLRAGELLTGALCARVPLLYGDDDQLGLIQEFRDALSPYFAFVLSDPALSRALHSKQLFQALAERRQLPVPRRLEWSELGEFDRPVLVKPRVKTDWDSSAVFSRLFGGAGKARIFPDGRAVLRDPLAQSLAEELAVQEYIPGGDRALWSFHGFADERGKLLAWFIGRKIRTYPALTGDSSYLELAHDAGLGALGHALVQQIGLKGVFKMDFKRHAETGRFYLLEVNARFNLWHYLGAKGGVNLAQLAYDYVTRGVRVAPLQTRARYRWLSPRLDYLAYRNLAARGELSAGAWLASLASSRKLYDLFAWTDPMPFFVVLWDEIKHLSRLRRRVMRWLSTAS